MAARYRPITRGALVETIKVMQDRNITSISFGRLKTLIKETMTHLDKNPVANIPIENTQNAESCQETENNAPQCQITNENMNNDLTTENNREAENHAPPRDPRIDISFAEIGTNHLKPRNATEEETLKTLRTANADALAENNAIITAYGGKWFLYRLIDIDRQANPTTYSFSLATEPATQSRDNNAIPILTLHYNATLHVATNATINHYQRLDASGTEDKHELDPIKPIEKNTQPDLLIVADNAPHKRARTSTSEDNMATLMSKERTPTSQASHIQDGLGGDLEPQTTQASHALETTHRTGTGSHINITSILPTPRSKPVAQFQNHEPKNPRPLRTRRPTIR